MDESGLEAACRASALARSSVRCGYLWKYGTNIEAWKRRFFVLKPATHLYYFLSEKDTQPRGCIDMDVFSTVRHVDRTPDGRVVFEISAGGGGADAMSFLLTARDEKEASEWMDDLINSRFTTLSMERDVLKEQENHFLREVEALETQVHQLQGYADQRHVAEDALSLEREQKTQLLAGIRQLDGACRQGLSCIGTQGPRKPALDTGYEGNMGYPAQEAFRDAISQLCSKEGISTVTEDDVEGQRDMRDEVDVALSTVSHAKQCMFGLVGMLAQSCKERDDKDVAVASLRRALAAKEQECETLKHQLKTTQCNGRRSLCTVAGLYRKQKQRYLESVLSMAEMQHLVCRLQSINRQLRQQKRIVVQELVRRREAELLAPEQQSSAQKTEHTDLLSDVSGASGEVLEDKSSDCGTEGENVPAGAETGEGGADGRPTSGLLRSLGSNLVSTIVNNAHPKIEMLGLIASDSFSRSISLRNLLSLDNLIHGDEPQSPIDTHLSAPETHAVNNSWMGEEYATDNLSASNSRLIEYEVEFSSRKVGLRFNNSGERVVVGLYDGPELELMDGSGGEGWTLPKLTGAQLVGVNGMTVEHVAFNEVTRILAKAGRPVRMRFRERIERTYSIDMEQGSVSACGPE